MEMSTPRLSIIVVNFNKPEYTIDCLKSLRKITYKNYEVIVVENGSSDDSLIKLKKYLKGKSNFKLITNKKNLGFAGGNNAGFKVSTGEYILLLNNDTKVEPGFVEPAVERLRGDKNVGILQSKLLIMDKPKYLDNVASYLTSFGFLYHMGYMQKDNGQYDKFITSMSGKGAALFIKREVLSLGLFDDDYFAYFEETDLCWRAWVMGWEVGFEPKSIVYHKMGVTSLAMQSEFIQYHSFKNRIASILKNASLSTLIWMMPLHLAASFMAALVFLFMGKRKVFGSVMRAYSWNIKRIRKTLKKRKLVQKQRKLSDSEIFKETFKNPPLSFYKSHLLLLTGSFK